MREWAISGRVILYNEKKVEVKKKKGVLFRIQTLEITGRWYWNQVFILSGRWNCQCRCEKEMAINTEKHQMVPQDGPQSITHVRFCVIYILLWIIRFFFQFFCLSSEQNPIGFPAFGESPQPDGLRRGNETDAQTHSNLCEYETLRLLLFHTESAIEYRI